MSVAEEAKMMKKYTKKELVEMLFEKEKFIQTQYEAFKKLEKDTGEKIEEANDEKNILKTSNWKLKEEISKLESNISSLELSNDNYKEILKNIRITIETYLSIQYPETGLAFQKVPEGYGFYEQPSIDEALKLNSEDSGELLMLKRLYGLSL